MRRTIAMLIAAGLALALVWWWFQPADDAPPVTEAAPTTTTSTTTTTTLVTTTTTEATTTTTTAGGESHVVETVEEAEEILRELWFGWFEGIYNQDEDRIREVVATEHQRDLAVGQFDVMSFERPPMRDDIDYSDTEILEASATCTVIWTTAELSGFLTDTASDVHVLRWVDGWKFFSLWAFRDDLWEADCAARLE